MRSEEDVPNLLRMRDKLRTAARETEFDPVEEFMLLDLMNACVVSLCLAGWIESYLYGYGPTSGEEFRNRYQTWVDVARAGLDRAVAQDGQRWTMFLTHSEVAIMERLLDGAYGTTPMTWAP